jgi:hypothetical protein
VLEQHHKIPARFGGTDKDENLAMLCANCHTVLERLYNESFWERVGDLSFDATEADSDQALLGFVPEKSGDEQAVVSDEQPLDELASTLVSENRVSEVQSGNKEVDIQLIMFEFDLKRNDAILLKKLIQRERIGPGSKQDPSTIRREERNRIIRGLVSDGVSQAKIASAIGLSQPTISKVVNENPPGERL